MINVTFSQQELNALFNLLDLGVKQGGLPVAASAAAIQQRVAVALQGPQPELPVTEVKTAKTAPYIDDIEEIAN